jgi:AcrR family transcriptional regulator
MTAARPAATARPDRRQNILLSAEKLFAQHGYHAVSIRQIADEAGVPLALVGYYFGAKQQLYHAIFEHWSSMISERLASLQQAMADGSGDRLQRLVEAFIGPVIRLRASVEGEYYALLMTRGLSLQSEEEDAIIREFFRPHGQGFHRCLSHHAGRRSAWRQPRAGGVVLPVCAGCAAAPHQRYPRAAPFRRQEPTQRPGRDAAAGGLHHAWHAWGGWRS